MSDAPNTIHDGKIRLRMTQELPDGRCRLLYDARLPAHLLEEAYAAVRSVSHI